MVAGVNVVQLLGNHLHIQGKQQQRVHAHQILKHQEGPYRQVVE